MIRNTLLAAVAATAMLGATMSSAFAYVGGWYYDNNPGGWEVLALGDSSDDSYLSLRGTEMYCGRPGASYAKMRNVLERNGTSGEQVTWWIDHECSQAHVRICIENWRGERACSTYRDEGWNF